MPPRICTACDAPHVTTDYYIRHGEVICAPAYEDQLRRETRERWDDHAAVNPRFGYAESVSGRRGRPRFNELGMTTRDDQ